ncbi:hypothetical protein [Chitinophaga sp. CF418]|uniref:hypothetical protein n=1 Tax=Chitinophaga sp. CF418 TaxID=1855287 RepID=UPI000913E6E4|nr:hypothetical protein [Chitinophaga sp. CF418]SHN07946.1 hypothetical protein SAMN05216311_10552 [Chitinophaga sp. CF418]
MSAIQLEKNLSGYANVKVNDFSIDIDKIECGVIFLYCTWSPAIIQLHSLLTSLQNYQQIVLLGFDIDEEEALQFFGKQGLHSDGWGETYWVRKGEVVSFLKKYGPQSMEQLISNNKMLL